jgi:hypothetical protein
MAINRQVTDLPPGRARVHALVEKGEGIPIGHQIEGGRGLWIEDQVAETQGIAITIEKRGREGREGLARARPLPQVAPLDVESSRL